MENNNITLRDYFAGLALQYYFKKIKTKWKKGCTPHYIANLCYYIADVMLEAREE